MDFHIGDLFNNIGIQVMLIIGISSFAYLLAFLVIHKITAQKDFANLIGGIAFLAAFYIAFITILLPSLTFLSRI